MLNNYQNQPKQTRRNPFLNEPQVQVLAKAHTESNIYAEILSNRWATIGLISLLVLEAAILQGWLIKLV